MYKKIHVFFRDILNSAYTLVGGEIMNWMVILCCAGGAAAIWKILFSGRGSINIGPFKASWGN